MPDPTRCHCDGRYQGCEHGSTCAVAPGGRWSPYFCPDCDKRRVDHIGQNLRGIAADLGKPAR
jgi:hypothetical protein